VGEASRKKARRRPGTARGAARAAGEARPRKPKGAAARTRGLPRDGGLRRDLIDAALELVEASGTRGLGWREIARRAGVSHSAAYRHFENKEALLAAVAEEGFHRLTERMVEQVAEARDDVASRFEGMAVAYVEFAAESPARFRVMFGRDIPDINKHPALREAHDFTDGLFRAGVAQVLENVGKGGMTVDIDAFTLMAWSLVHGLASLIVDGRVGDVSEAAVDPGDRVRAMTDLIKTFAQRPRA